ncbi:Autophagy-related protein 2 [Cytospora mali]|uniref:Autophagy-related protein 2 n=1 Tax=Cytospora mali TaxID=578113 RepID=A0A194VH88_CYTMA|nr:Autophagy-related protein 2 [Valsa mali var. pyri (nom. inval.)]
MASIFQSFRSSAMPKRLLRYAMASFDIFEDDALDLENLDLGFGLRNTFEFKDVGLKVEKISKQLDLPPEYRIKKAKVSRLQLTVPLDLYSSSIELTAVGVHICLQVSPTDRQGARPNKEESRRPDPAFVPTAADLAQSFLETQPSREKRALEDALAAERQDLGASVAMSEDSSEDDQAYGTGQGLTLPAFLTDFLQSVVDRTQVAIKDVTLHLDIEVPVEPKSTETELVTLQLSLDELDVEGVTTQVREDGDGARIVPKEGKRHIILNKIRASIISDTDLLSSLARSPSMTSAASMSPVVTARCPPPGTGPLHVGNFHESIMEGSAGDLSQSEQLLRDSEEAFNIPYELGGSNAANGNEEQGQEPASSLSTPRASIYHDFAGHNAESSIYSPNVATDDQSLWPPSLENSPALSQDTHSREPFLEGSVSSDSASEGSEAQRADDLAESQFFSHEEAESMYMSAFSQGQSQQLRATSMPGAWDSIASTPEHSPKAERKSPLRSHDQLSGSAKMPIQEALAVPQDLGPSAPTPSIARGRSEAEASKDASLMPDPINEPSATARIEETETRGPKRLVKEILSLASISVYVPTKHKHIQVSSVDGTSQLAHSTFHSVPGAFSVFSTTAPASVQYTANTEESERDHNDGSIEVELAPFEVCLDTSVGFLLAMVARRLLETAKVSQQPSEQVEKSPSQKADSSTPGFKLSAQKISVVFLEKILTVSDIAARASDPAMSFGSDVLLRAEIEHLSAIASREGSTTESNIRLEKFRFGYHDSDILSFDREAQMRASVRDAFPEAGADISVRLSASKESSRCEVNTLPLRVHIDLQRLEETFSWFGGLSGFLQMGSSMTSSGPHGKPTPKSAKPRGVRFDIPVQPDNTAAAMSESKTDVRLGGLQLDLVGKNCGVNVRTTAVKLVSRGGIVGVGISKIQAAGPYVKRASDEPPINIVLSNTRLDYLITPRDDDLDRLLALITPSKGQFDDNDDEIMVDTLLRQRRKGSVLKLTFDDVQAHITRLQKLDIIPALGEELARLGTVTKYLPEDDRPGLLTLGLIHNLVASVDVGGRFGTVNANLSDFELAHIAFPSLAAFGINSLKVDRNSIEELIGSTIDVKTGLLTQSPVLMVRVIGDEMEPVIKVRMRNLNFEYRVPTVMDALGLSSETTPQEFDAMLAASVANFGEQAHTALVGNPPLPAPQPSAAPKSSPTKPTIVNVAFRDCLLGLNPLALTSKLNVVLQDAHVEVALPSGDDVNAVVDLRKAAILLVDDISLLNAPQRLGPSRHRGSDAQRPTDMVSTLCSKGYVNICQISSARVAVQATTSGDGDGHIDVELRDDLLVLETCADSTHTLIALTGALKPPTPPSREVKYKTEVIPMQDMLASITADAFGNAEGDYNFDDDFAIAQEMGGGNDSFEGELIGSSPLGIEAQYHSSSPRVAESIFDATSSSIISDRTTTHNKSGDVFPSQPDSLPHSVEFGLNSEVEIHENFFGKAPVAEGSAHRWNSAKNRYDDANEVKAQRSPLKVRVRDVHIIWNLFDGYDWQHTREAITRTVEEVETKAFERRNRAGRRSLDEPDFEEQDVVGDCLFNSIYVSIPANHDPRELVGGINHQLDDTESIAATSVTTTTTRTVAGQFRSRSKKLRLNRSRRHKITFELQGVNVDLIKFPAGSGETDTSIDVRVHNLEVFDHIPTSTWKKFATYDLDAGERELGASMAHLEILLVKPVPELAAAEFVLKATVLPLRLHVDQDALDFIQRFFQFKDESQVPAQSSPSDEAFIQRAEINAIPVTLDFKPKRVDYAGLRGGRTSEFMNFMILERARMTLRHTIVYGTTGWERLGNTLNDIWTPDVKRTQLASVLAGVAPVRHLVNVGSGFRDLIEIPIKEYKKDGRIVRSIGKGAAAFARTTGTEIVKLGAKMATGTQYVLQGAEGMLTKNSEEGSAGAGEQSSIQTGWEEEDMGPEEKKQISLYADQPTGVVQGLRHAYSSLARDLNVARDAIIAVPAEVMESRNAGGAARAVMNRAPTIIFRPAIGATRAVGQALMGATNALDPENLRRVEDVS